MLPPLVVGPHDGRRVEEERTRGAHHAEERKARSSDERQIEMSPLPINESSETAADGGQPPGTTRTMAGG
jgi:hypothetical protein